MRSLLLAAVLAVAALPAQAGLFDKNPETAAQEAVKNNLLAATIWVDASWGFRNQGAANALSKAHSRSGTSGATSTARRRTAASPSISAVIAGTAPAST